LKNRSIFKVFSWKIDKITPENFNINFLPFLWPSTLPQNHASFSGTQNEWDLLKYWNTYWEKSHKFSSSLQPQMKITMLQNFNPPFSVTWYASTLYIYLHIANHFSCLNNLLGNDYDYKQKINLIFIIINIFSPRVNNL
jgi:hypothetical protein